MLPAPIPAYESERIASLRKMLLLSTPDEESFDRVTRAAQRMFNVPIALVSLIDTNRQWFKSCIGLPVRETERDVSFCGHAILAEELFVIENALLDPRFADNPIVTGDPHVIFYAGRPLKNAEGFFVGTLCIIDHEPRTFSPEDRQSLQDLGYWIEQIFYARELSQAETALLSELDETRRSSLLDPMLNIWTSSAISNIVEREALREFRNRSPLSVMMVCLNSFEDMVAMHGATATDLLLIEFVKRMNSAIRPYDSLGRWSAYQFMIVFPDTDRTAALNVAQKIRRVADYPLLVGEDIVELSISIGIGGADFVEETPEPPILIERAQQDIH